MERGPGIKVTKMNVLSILKNKKTRILLLANSRKLIARNTDSSDYTSAHMSPVKLSTYTYAGIPGE